MTATLTPIEQQSDALVLIDPFQKKVHVYRSQIVVEILMDPQIVSGEPLLPGFVLEMRAFWE